MIRAQIEKKTGEQIAALDARFGRDTGYGHQRLPGEGEMDGFFYACLRKA